MNTNGPDTLSIDYNQKLSTNNHCCSSELKTLEKNIQNIKKFFPSIHFTASKTYLAQLNSIFDKISETFSFDSSLKNIVKKHKNSGILPFPLKGKTLEKRASACNKVISHVLKNIEKFHDKNLVLLWEKIVNEKNWNSELKNLTAKKIREWLKNNNNSNAINSVTELHLNNKISFITPEINAFEKLKFLCICNSNLKAYPDVINSHPNKKYLHLCYTSFQ
jgi:hypothetical protein